MSQRTSRQAARRQRLRRAVLLTAFLLFPVVFYFMSPYLIIESAARGIVNGSFLLFGMLLLSGLIFGRGWCAWVCPAAGLQEACFPINDRPAPGGRWDWIKWGIWLPWVAAIGLAAYGAGGYQRIDPTYPNGSWLSIVEPAGFVMYYLVLGLILVLPLAVGRRGFCHYGCWIAPFLIIGRKVGNRMPWPSLRLAPAPAQCIACHVCNRHCPMSLDVEHMVLAGRMEHDECILCGTCVDVCTRRAIAYRWGAAAPVATHTTKTIELIDR